MIDLKEPIAVVEADAISFLSRVKKFLKDILTGKNNETIAIGRYMGLVGLVLAVFTPIVELLTVLYKQFSIDDWSRFLSQWQVFIPTMIAATIGVIAGTAFTEPKEKDSDKV